MKTALKILLSGGLFLLLSGLIPAEDSRTRPVTISYCDGTTLQVYPYSFVTRGDNTTFSCYEARISPINGGLRYGFEDSNDFDYNDLVIDLWITGNGTGAPVLHVGYVSKDASYSHWIRVVFGGTDRLVFKAEESIPGAVFDIPLPVRPCPGFKLYLNPDSASVRPGESAEYTIHVSPENGFNSTVTLEISGLPAGVAHTLSRDFLQPQDSSELSLKTSTAVQPGDYEITVTGRSGELVRKATAYLNVHSPSLPVFRKSSTKTTVKPGEEYSYAMVLENIDSRPLASLKITDRLAPDLVYLSQESSLEFQVQGQRLYWQGYLEPGEKMEIQYRVKVREEARAGTRIDNQAKLEADGLTEPILSNPVSVTVFSEPVIESHILFQKRSELPQTEVGRTLRFRFTLENRSPSMILNPVIEDFLPQGFSYVAGSTLLDGMPFRDAEGRRRLRWQLPAIHPGSAHVLSFQSVIGADVRRGRNINRGEFRGNDNTGRDILLEAEALISVSDGGLIFFSGVEGTVFIDRNHDSWYDPGDTPLSGIEVWLSSGQKSVTDKDGRYSFPSLYPGEYALGLNRLSLPEKYRLEIPYSIPVVLSDGLTDTVDIPLLFKGEETEKTARIEGIVFFDRNRNGRFDSGGDPPCTDFLAVLNSKLTMHGNAGRFLFTHLEPGKHKLEILYGGGKKATKEITIARGNNRVEVPLRFTGIQVVIKGEK